ncbi:polysaccharide deacetylase family protein [Methylobacterium sp. NEAU K]|uniref:polysaccharide deacetylase family protein n=1 Tax=Methylobacterium sp. NEAU K TaxID=3064946 RepID=UPI0027366ECD|nr:polysaccharide deacetylase family protein [Methylobacterium sp. NEAU K]MDP4005839.1 polysaccharide deacetylase family protein [Methylobacterium sp. NEAU K]
MIPRPIKSLARTVGLTRPRVAAARMACERTTLALAGPRRALPGGRILCYHAIGQPECGVNDLTPGRFRHQIELALRLGYRFVPAATIAEGRGEPWDLAITFDDGWHSVLGAAAPILREHEVPWSLFVVSGWLDRPGTGPPGVLGWREVEALAAAGAEIGSHSITHPDFGRISAEQAAEELEGSRSAIAARLGIRPDSFAIPLGQSANWTPAAARAAERAGYRIVYAQAVETRPGGTVGRSFVTYFDNDLVFGALLGGAYDAWEEWI